VGMGLLAVGANTMGVCASGPLSMGLMLFVKTNISPSDHQYQLHGSHQGSDNPALMAYPSREQAELEAKKLGCTGVHAMGKLWMPCNEHPPSKP